GGSRGGPGLFHGEGPGGRVGHRVRGAGRGHPEGRARIVEALRGGRFAGPAYLSHLAQNARTSSAIETAKPSAMTARRTGCEPTRRERVAPPKPPAMAPTAISSPSGQRTAPEAMK